ncbi:hypothetical protein AB0878_17620 [Amycolatopsis sp. NPDC047767]|uniref:hypothetical protein n=1 Tax=Amycolatopsis sp. NPDC047767 TaxID=3156765 RepID=UPI003455D81A
MFTAFITAIGLLVLLAVGIATRQDADWWAAWGSWAGGIGSIAAAVAALWIARRGWELDERKTSERNARKFAVWVTSNGGLTPVALFANTTDLPVYDVVVKTRVLTFNHTFNLGTLSTTERVGAELPAIGRRLTHSIRADVFTKIGQAAYYEPSADGQRAASNTAYVETLDAIRKIELTVTFRQGEYRWRATGAGRLSRL